MEQASSHDDDLVERRERFYRIRRGTVFTFQEKGKEGSEPLPMLAFSRSETVITAIILTGENRVALAERCLGKEERRIGVCSTRVLTLEDLVSLKIIME